MGNTNWRGRVFTSLCSLVSFILLLLTAIILYIGIEVFRNYGINR
jgi:hypothetical protein